MSEPQDNSSLDALIDDVARSLTNGPVPGDFRARVLSRIRGADDHRAKARWRVPGLALASACVAAVTIYVGWGFIPTKDAPADKVSGSGRTNPDVVAGSSRMNPDVRSNPDVVSGFNRTNPDVVSGFSRTKSDAVSGFSGTESDPPDGFESIAGSPLTIEPVDDSRLTAIELMSMETMPIESLELGALGAQ